MYALRSKSRVYIIIIIFRKHSGVKIINHHSVTLSDVIQIQITRVRTISLAHLLLGSN